MIKYPFKSDDWALFDGYDGSSGEISELQRHFSAKWNVEVPRYVITRMAKTLGKARTKEPRWTEEDIEYLMENYGRIPDKVLCRKINRTRAAIVLKTKRLGINRKMNFLTSWSVAEICGIPCSKTVVMWISKGYLRGKHSPTACGHNQMWQIEDDDLAGMVKRYPWLCHRERMPESWYKTLVDREWERDPWVYSEEASRMVGVKDGHYLLKYMRRGWLRGEKMPGGPNHGNQKWVFRTSWIMGFLANDPRKRHHRRALATVKVGKNLLHNGAPVCLFDLWMLICPRCGQAVSVKTPHRKMYGPSIQALFESSLNGHKECVHGELVDLTQLTKEEEAVNVK